MNNGRLDITALSEGSAEPILAVSELCLSYPDKPDVLRNISLVLG